MLIQPLARAASRPGLRACSLRPHPLHHGIRVFTSSPLHRKDAHGQRPNPGAKPAVEATKPAADPAAAKVAKTDPLLQEQVLTNKEQRKADWAIMKEMSAYLWPKDNLGTRFRVGLSVGLLVGAKLLNVQVPFYFKSIVDAMNIDFVAVGGAMANTFLKAKGIAVGNSLVDNEDLPLAREIIAKAEAKAKKQYFNFYKFTIRFLLY